MPSPRADFFEDGGLFTTRSLSRINNGVSFPAFTVKVPIPRGRENRLGPAEPGLNNMVRPWRPIVGR